ncbi:MAG TPA: hypothetical protein VHM70_11370 [Polyangiaceae bacterium]|jgi:hypothetical protein|nr:hypothetical protein [Polyangiaceae bacterium]
MSTPRLVLEAHPNYAVAWNRKTDTWSVKYMPDLRKAAGNKIIDLPKVDFGGGAIDAVFRAIEPGLSEADAARFTAHALLDFFWAEPHERRDEITSVAVTALETGRRYEFLAPLGPLVEA